MFLVTGATGGVGNEVLSQLSAAGHPVRALSRRPDRVDRPEGTPVVRADLSDPSTLPAAFAGGTALFLYALRGDATAVLDLARQAGIRRVVLLSSMAIESAPDGDIARAHRTVERAIEASGLPWTFLRGGTFASNALWWAPQVRADGVIRERYPEMATAPVAPADIAEVGMRALTEAGHAGRVYSLTGEQIVTQAEQAKQLGAALGRPVRMEQIDDPTYLAMMTERLGEQFARTLLSVQTMMRERTPEIHRTVAAVTGRPARTFADWANANAHRFR